MLPPDTEKEAGKGKRNAKATTNQDDEANEEQELARPRKTTRLAEVDSEDAETDSDGEEDSDGDEGRSTGAPSNEVLPKKTSEVKKQQSQPMETSRSGTVPLAPVRPEAPYERNVLGLSVLFRPDPQAQKYWIRGEIEQCEQKRLHIIQKDGNILTRETLDHVIKCSDDEDASYTVNLQKQEQSGNIKWM